MHLSTLDDHIFRWRSVSGDGNCFYRSVIFAYLEHIVFQRDIISLKKIIVEINTWFEKDYIHTKLLHKDIANDIVNIDKNLVTRILYLIYEFLDKPLSKKQDENVSEGVFLAYEILLKCFNCCSKFDLVRIILYYYTIIFLYLLIIISLGNGLVL